MLTTICNAIFVQYSCRFTNANDLHSVVLIQESLPFTNSSQCSIRQARCVRLFTSSFWWAPTQMTTVTGVNNRCPSPRHRFCRSAGYGTEQMLNVPSNVDQNTSSGSRAPPKRGLHQINLNSWMGWRWKASPQHTSRDVLIFQRLWVWLWPWFGWTLVGVQAIVQLHRANFCLFSNMTKAGDHNSHGKGIT